ncbi:hypothetical protein JMJ77_0007832, partial [Colletotrichum scovillei]
MCPRFVDGDICFSSTRNANHRYLRSRHTDFYQPMLAIPTIEVDSETLWKMKALIGHRTFSTLGGLHSTLIC